MNASIRHFGWSALALFALVGCETAPTPAPPEAAPTPSNAVPDADKNQIESKPVEPAKVDPPKDKAATTDADKLSDKELAEIKELPADQQPIALAQLTCPVSGGNLGGMGMPIKQEVNGKVFYLCCDGCLDKVKEDPAGVLAKLKK